MSDLRVSKSFAEDFAMFETGLRLDGYNDEAIESIKQAVRDDWNNEEYRPLWIAQIKKEGDFMREIQAI